MHTTSPPPVTGLNTFLRIPENLEDLYQNFTCQVISYVIILIENSPGIIIVQCYARLCLNITRETATFGGVSAQRKNLGTICAPAVALPAVDAAFSVVKKICKKQFGAWS